MVVNCALKVDLFLFVRLSFSNDLSMMTNLIFPHMKFNSKVFVLVLRSLSEAQKLKNGKSVLGQHVGNWVPSKAIS
jgi:hypothetical protein